MQINARGVIKGAGRAVRRGGRRAKSPKPQAEQNANARSCSLDKYPSLFCSIQILLCKYSSAHCAVSSHLDLSVWANATTARELISNSTLTSFIVANISLVSFQAAQGRQQQDKGSNSSSSGHAAPRGLPIAGLPAHAA